VHKRHNVTVSQLRRVLHGSSVRFNVYVQIQAEMESPEHHNFVPSFWFKVSSLAQNYNESKIFLSALFSILINLYLPLLSSMLFSLSIIAHLCIFLLIVTSMIILFLTILISCAWDSLPVRNFFRQQVSQLQLLLVLSRHFILS
jgi:cellulose synthase/poly-beta-1,6-N-acetylglucosamine synthase-like glycosyltransferase